MSENKIIGNAIALGVDIGGSHITTALIDLSTRTILPDSYHRNFINSQGEADEIIENCCALINESFANVDILERRIGIAIPGPFDYNKGISLMQNQDKFDSLYQVNVRTRFAHQLGIPTENIRFINDAESFLQGEVFAGAARNYHKVLGLTLGTGLGSSLYLDGEVRDADLWHSAFRDGIAEDYLCGRWFVERYEEITGKIIAGVKDLTQLEVSKGIFIEFAQNFAQFIGPLVQQYQAEIVVIGGNISNAHGLFLKELNDFLKQNNVFVKVEISQLHENAALLGAASCWEMEYSESKINQKEA